MTLTRGPRSEFWALSPFRRVASLREEVDDLFNFALGRLTGSTPENGRSAQSLEGWFPVVDIYEDKDIVQVKAELPGLKKEDIEISLHNGYLTLSGERKQEIRQDTETVHRTERWSGRFYRSISLPCRVEADKIKATYNEGVLTVALPKAEEAKPKQIPISVQ